MGSADIITVIRECLAQIFRREKRYREEEPLLLDALADLAKREAVDPTARATKPMESSSNTSSLPTCMRRGSAGFQECRVFPRSENHPVTILVLFRLRRG
jgi:hypothetical protein